MKIRATTIGRYVIELSAPFVTSLRTVYDYPVSTFAIVDHDGINGIGEAVATPAIIGDTAIEIDRQLHALSMLLIGKELSVEEIASLSRTGNYHSSVIAAVDLALLDYQAKKNSQTISEYLGIHTTSIKTDVTIPICELSDIEKILEERKEFSSLKIKMDQRDINQNISVIAKIHEYVPMATLRIDPNQAWDVSYTVQFLEQLSQREIDIEYLEQPIDRYDISGMAEIKKNSQTPIMADESCFTLEDISRLLEHRACDFVNIKILKSGGYTNALAMARFAMDNGLKVSVGSMMEGTQGIYVAALFASIIEPFSTHDLDAAWWFRQSPFTYANGTLMYG